MRRLAVWMLLPAILLSGCGSREAAPAPAVPAGQTSVSPPAAPKPEQSQAPQPAEQLTLPKVEISQVRYLDLWAPGPSNPRVRLDPHQDGALLQALLTALNGAEMGRPRSDIRNVHLSATIRLLSDESLILALPEPAGPVQVWWQNQYIEIDNAALAEALAALEPELAEAQKPGIRIWAVDPTGKNPAELLLEQPKDLMLEGVSPDDRYLLLVQQLGQYKGDFTAVPYLLDRTTGKLTEGHQTSIRFARWSGDGFYVDWLAHLDLKLNETHFDQLARALQLKEREREIIAISFSSDGNQFAALVGLTWGIAEPVDMVLGRRDGTGLAVMPKAVRGNETQIGTLARIALSPDGTYVAVSDKDGAALLRVADPDPRRWLRFPGGGLDIAWAPDSMHVWFPTGEIVDLSGKTVFNTGQVTNLIWQADGHGGVVTGYDFMRSFRLDGSLTDIPSPTWSAAAGFLPDGRVLVWRTVHSQ